MPSLKYRKCLPLFLLTILSACGGGGGGAGVEGGSGVGAATSSIPTSPPDTTGTLIGRVLNSRTDAPLAGAVVTAAGRTTTTERDGSYLLENLPLSRVVVVATAAGHAEQTAVAELNSTNGRQWVIVRPLPVDATLPFDATRPQTLADPASSARVTLPANALVRANGQPPVGTVTASLTRIDPGANPGAMPGDYRTTGGTLQSFGALDVTFRDALGQALNLAVGRTATIRIPVASGQATLPATSPLYWFNTSTGLWVREGQATLVGSGAGAYFEGTVSHFTTWNADDVINSVLVSGRLTNELNTGLSGVTVVTLGVDYAGIASTVTDTSGNFSVSMKAGATARVLAFLNDVESTAQTVGPRTANFAIASPLILTSAARARLMLGAPQAVENLTITPDSCCRFYNVRVPFSTNGPRLSVSSSGNIVAARWELRHRFVQPTSTPEVVFTRLLPDGTFIPDGRWSVDGVWDAPINNLGSVPLMSVDYSARRIDSAPGDTSGVIEFLFSANIGRLPFNITPTAVEYTIVLVMDVRDASTGKTVTVRSEPRLITIALARPLG